MTEGESLGFAASTLWLGIGLFGRLVCFPGMGWRDQAQDKGVWWMPWR